MVFVGFENAAVLGEETRNPKRNVGIAVLGSVLLTAAYMTIGCYAMIIAQGKLWLVLILYIKGYSNAKYLYLIDSATDLFSRHYISKYFAVFIDLAGVTATFNVAASTFNMNFRLLYSLGREHVLGNPDKLVIHVYNFLK